MSEADKFLDRWSRRKRGAVEESAPVEAKDAAKPPPPAAASKQPAAKAPFDPASLPPIESIGANSDIRAFLKPGVPPDLSRAALRRAWAADPAIRDFIGLVENGWDFNDPNGVPGFGPLQASEVGRLLAQVIGAPLPTETAASQQIARAGGNSDENPPSSIESKPEQQSLKEQPAVDQAFAVPQKESVQRSEDHTAMQNNSDEQAGAPPSRRRGHGGALPKL